MGLFGVRRLTPYCSSKAGLIGFYESLRQELIDTKVRISVIHPGLINTGMFKGVSTRLQELFPVLEAFQVSDAVLKVLENRVDDDVYMPTYAKVCGGFAKFLHLEIVNWLKLVAGANFDMDTWKGSTSSMNTVKEGDNTNIEK